MPRAFETEAAAELTNTALHGAYGASSLVVHLLVPPTAGDLHELHLRQSAAPTSRGGAGDGVPLTERSRATRKAHQLHRRRAKIVLLTRDGEDLKARLQQYAHEFAQREKSHPGGARHYFSTPAGRGHERASWTSRMTGVGPSAGAPRGQLLTGRQAPGAGGGSRRPHIGLGMGNATKLTAAELLAAGSFPTGSPSRAGMWTSR